MYTVTINFQKDFDDYLKQELTSRNYIVDNALSSQDLRIKFFNFRKRTISQMPRKVLLSSSFICPSDVQIGWDLLKAKIENGEDLTPHLSKFLTDLDYNDSLLNDWGIYHLHLGKKLEANGSGFIERDGPLLFLFVDKSRALCINIGSHGSWTEQQMVKTIHDNWPEAIECFWLNAVGLVHVPTNDDIKKLRRAGVNSAMEIEPGVVYSSMGGGLTTAKTSVDVMTSVFKYTKRVRQLEKHVKDNAELIGKDLADKHNYVGMNLHFTLMFDGADCVALEQNTGKPIRLGPF